MKIMFFTLSLQNGGAERVLASLSNGMAKKDDVIVVTVYNNKDHYELDNSVKRVRLDKKVRIEKSKLKNKLQKLSFKRIKKLVEVINNESPDVVIAFLPLPSFYIMMAKRLSKKIRKVPVILSERADPSREYSNKLVFVAMKKLFKYADGFAFQTKDARNFYNGIIKCKTAIIENPINEVFLNHEIPKKRRKTIVSCGRLEVQKNFKLLIGAFADISKKFSEYTLEIYGDGGQKDELLAYANELGVKGKVFFKGRVDDLADRIADAGVFVLSSDYEGMPNALMEAMALGIPCISTDCPVGGPKTLIENDHNGILTKVGNRKQLVDAVSRIISNKKFASELSKRAFKSSKKYEVSKIANKWMVFMEEVVGKK